MADPIYNAEITEDTTDEVTSTPDESSVEKDTTPTESVLTDEEQKLDDMFMEQFPEEEKQ